MANLTFHSFYSGKCWGPDMHRRTNSLDTYFSINSLFIQCGSFKYRGGGLKVNKTEVILTVLLLTHFSAHLQEP